jgi:Tol biopolymer transport system component
MYTQDSGISTLKGSNDMRSTVLICILILISAIAMAAETTLVTATCEIVYTSPVWSPNGRSIAYIGVSEADQSRSVYLATLAGVWKTKPLVQGADYPVWSPDSARLAFNKGGLSVMDLVSGKSGVKNAVKPYPLGWSPNGRYILCSSNPQEEAAAITDTKVGKTLQTAVGVESVWMADGKLLTSVGGDLQIVDPATGKSSVVAGGINAKRPFIPKGASYAWVWISENPPHGKGIYRVDLKTGKLEKQVAMHAKSLYFSPDGTQFAFLADWALDARTPIQTCLYMGSTFNWEFKIAAKGAGEGASWSPDSKSIAYATAEGNINILKL